MENVLVAFYLLVILYLPSPGQKHNICTESFTDHTGETISNDSICRGTTLLMITSYTCGPCIASIPTYNKIQESFPHVFVFGILDNDSLYIEQFKEKNGKEFWFPKVVDTDLTLSKKYWKKKLWPEYHIYYKGDRVKVISGASDKNYQKLFALLEELEAEASSN